jgi:hypothetical protein
MNNNLLNEFGGRDERAEHQRFESLCGGPSAASRLFNIRKNGFFKTDEAFFNKAAQEGFNREQCQALLAL